MKKGNPNFTFENIIKDEDLTSISKDIGEVVLDDFLDEGILKDIPILGSFLSSLKFVNSISQHIFLKKIFLFLSHVEKVPLEKRKKVIDKINSSSKYRNRVGETIFEILDKIESEGKPEIIGKLFSAVLKEEIDYQVYLKSVHIIKTVFYFDLVDLSEKYDGEKVNGSLGDMIFTSELITDDSDLLETYNKSLEIDDYKPKPIKTTLSELGKVIIEIGMR